MPVYEYQCEDCATQFELKRRFNDTSVAPCPRCKGKTRRLFSPVPVIFKGPGFYVTDSRKDNPKSDIGKAKSKRAETQT